MARKIPVGKIDRTLARGLAVTMHPHAGNACPVPACTPVLIDLGDGFPYVEDARRVYWGPALEADGAGRVVAYGVVQ